MARDMTLEELRHHLSMQSTAETMRKIGRIVLRHAADAESRAKEINQSVLQPRTGRLNQSIRATPKMDGSTITVELSAGGGRKNVKYAKVHEQDGYPGTYFIIKPVKAKYLTFPVSGDAFTPVGVGRGGGAGCGHLENRLPCPAL